MNDYYIPYRICVINEVDFLQTQEVLLTVFRVAFEWANKMGLKGKRVYNLHLQRAAPKSMSPMNCQSYLWCQIECTKEEREIWEEKQKSIAQRVVDDLLTNG